MKIEYTKKSIVITFSSPRRVLSSAPYSGGFYKTDTIVNLRTSSRKTDKYSPNILISDFLKKKTLNTHAVGFLTAAQLEFAQFIYLNEKDIKIFAIVTGGASNALNIAEKSPTVFTGEAFPTAGTVNIIIITNARLSSDCYVSTVITATEAKSAALFDLQVKSVITGNQATGTGTDAVAIVSGDGMDIQYAGGHTQYGQLLGEAVYTGVKKALSRQKVKYVNFNMICGEFDF